MREAAFLKTNHLSELLSDESFAAELKLNCIEVA